MKRNSQDCLCLRLMRVAAVILFTAVAITNSFAFANHVRPGAQRVSADVQARVTNIHANSARISGPSVFDVAANSPTSCGPAPQAPRPVGQTNTKKKILNPTMVPPCIPPPKPPHA